MIADDPFGKTFDCSCGRTHTIEPGQVVYAPDAAARLPGVCDAFAKGRRAAVLFDARTGAVAGEEVGEALASAGWQVQEMLLADPGPGRSPVCDDATKNALAVDLLPADVVVPVGSGVMSDLGKWLAWEAYRPFAAFATAASMNGYASANVAPTVQGVKTLVRARPPAAVFASPEVLRDAPFEMTAAGLGDALAKSTSSADWYLNHRLFGDYYCPKSVDLVADVEPLYLARPEDIRDRKPAAVEALFRALLLTGVAMTMAETSAPASGGEHLISHSLDMLAGAEGVEHDLHGRQVGVGTVVAAELYRRVLATESPRWAEPLGDVDRAFWGPLADGVAEQYAQKVPRLQAAREALAEGSAWDELRAALKPMLRPPETLRDCLSRAGAATTAEHIKTGRHRLLAVFRHADQMRSRFTILDLACLVGIMPAAAEEIIETWA